MQQIDYIEFWATKHCNLNCRGCSSCAPIAQEWYLNIHQLKADLTRLKDLELQINHINILGGEPLLHPQITQIMDCVKEIYPHTQLSMMTNGLLLPEMKHTFWESCVSNHVKLKITRFPIMPEPTILKIQQIMDHYHLDYQITNKKWFNKILVLDSHDRPEDVQQACGCNSAYNLYNGKISRLYCPNGCTNPERLFSYSLEYGRFAGYL